MKVDSRCTCGWELPVSVIPIRMTAGTRPSGATLAEYTQPGTFVALRCPRCERGHAFYLPHVAATAGESHPTGTQS